jgi:hypothetical protein
MPGTPSRQYNTPSSSTSVTARTGLSMLLATPPAPPQHADVVLTDRLDVELVEELILAADASTCEAKRE